MLLSALVHATLILCAIQPGQETVRADPGDSNATAARSSTQEPSTFQILPLQYAPADSLVQILRSFHKPGDTITCDSRTNALVVSAPAGRIEEICALVARLDRPAEEHGTAEPKQAQARSAAAELFAPVTRDLVIEFGGGSESPNLLVIARQYERITGQMFLISAETETLLASAPTGLGSSVNVVAGNVQAFVENLFAFSNFYMFPVPGTEPKLIKVFSTNTREGTTLAKRVHYLAAEEVESFGARHPAVPIATIYTMNTVDVRQLSNSMRTMFDSEFCLLLPAGATNSMIVTGSPSNVVHIIRLLHTIEESAGISSLPVPATAAQ